jgi:hypothetical protein
MNERIRELELEAIAYADSKVPVNNRYNDIYHSIVRGKFAELIVRECAENFAKVWYEQGLDIRGVELDKFMKRFDEHFGVEE